MFEFCKRTIKSNLPVALRWAVVILVVGLVATFTRTGSAAPVMFAFEAEGNIVFPVMQPGALPVIPIETGDTLTGRFTFDPDDQVMPVENPSISIILAELQINVGDFGLSTDTFSIEVFDDSLVVGTPSMPQVFEDFDGIRLGCSPNSSAECQPEVSELPSGGLFRVSIQMSLLGDLPVLNSTELPGDVGLWNGLDSLRSISIVFDAVDPNLATVVYLGTVGELSVVPEPSSVTLFPLLSSSLLLFRRDIFCV